MFPCLSFGTGIWKPVPCVIHTYFELQYLPDQLTDTSDKDKKYCLLKVFLLSYLGTQGKKYNSGWKVEPSVIRLKRDGLV